VPQNLFDIVQKNKTNETHYVELIRDLMQFNPDAGVAGVTKNSK
jgi:hypothetical protein